VRAAPLARARPRLPMCRRPARPTRAAPRRGRTGTYYAAILENRADFEGQVVGDIGAGSGILSLFAAQARRAAPASPRQTRPHARGATEPWMLSPRPGPGALRPTRARRRPADPPPGHAAAGGRAQGVRGGGVRHGRLLRHPEERQPGCATPRARLASPRRMLHLARAAPARARAPRVSGRPRRPGRAHRGGARARGGGGAAGGLRRAGQRAHGHAAGQRAHAGDVPVRAGPPAQARRPHVPGAPPLPRSPRTRRGHARCARRARRRAAHAAQRAAWAAGCIALLAGHGGRRTGPSLRAAPPA